MSVTLDYITDPGWLQQVKHESFTPFRLMVDEHELLCQELLRLLPGKRMVVRGVWRQQRVIAKLFFASGKASEHFAKELAGYQLLKEQPVNVPSLFVASEVSSTGIYVVLYEELYPIKRLSQLVLSESHEAAEQWLQETQKLLARLHHAGILQLDLHLDNFVLVHDELYVLDYTTIKFSREQQTALKNIALFYAQLPIQFHRLISKLFASYCDLRSWNDSIHMKHELKQQVWQYRWWRAKRWLAKCLRNSTEFVADYSLQKVTIYKRQYDSALLQALLSSPEQVLQEQKAQVIKAGNTSTLFKLTLGEQEFIVKRYNVKGAGHFATHCWRRSRALKSWCNANLLTLFNVPTAKPVALLEQRWLGLCGRSYFVMESLGVDTLLDHFMAGYDERLVAQTLDLLEYLAELQIAHGDLKAQNFMLNEGRLYLVDLDALQFFKEKKRWRPEFKKDLARFRRNWFRFPQVLKGFDLAMANRDLKER